MASIRALLAQLVFKEFSVEDVRDVSAHFRRFRVSGESLRGTLGKYFAPQVTRFRS